MHTYATSSSTADCTRSEVTIEFSLVNEISSYLENKAVRVFLSALAGAVVGTALGAVAVAATGLAGALLIGAAGGALIGVIYGIFCRVWQPPVGLERLNEIETHFAGRRDLLQAVAAVKTVLQNNPIEFAQSHDYHTFRRAMTVITDQVKTRPDLIHTWKVFLGGLEGRRVYPPGGKEVVMSTKMEIERLEGRPIAVDMETLQTSSPNLAKDLNEILAISAECFGYQAIPMPMLWGLVYAPGVSIQVARRRGTGEILGFAMTGVEHNQLHIYYLGRKAEAGMLGVGNQLLERLLAQPSIRQLERVYLEVRESNRAAIDMYERFGFEQESVDSDYYAYPDEAARIMKLNWARYDARAWTNRAAAA